MNLSEICNHLEGQLIGDGSLEISRIKTLEEATPKDISVILSPKALPQALKSKASAFIVFKKLSQINNQIIVTNPKKALAQTITLLSVCTSKNASPASAIYTKHVSKTASIGQGTTVHSKSVISDNVSIGKDCSIGKHVIIHPNVTIYDHTQIGDNVIIHAGTVIGSDGFGYYSENNQWHKIPHIGSVIIENNVEIGANTCIDRGCLGHTRIKEGTKIDNLVHIAHNTTIGYDCAIAAQVGFTGSSELGDHVMIGGQAGIDSSSITSHVVVAARAGVTKSITSPGIISGFPAWNHKSELKKEAFCRKISQEDKNEN